MGPEAAAPFGGALPHGDPQPCSAHPHPRSCNERAASWLLSPFRCNHVPRCRLRSCSRDLHFFPRCEPSRAAVCQCRCFGRAACPQLLRAPRVPPAAPAPLPSPISTPSLPNPAPISHSVSLQVASSPAASLTQHSPCAHMKARCEKRRQGAAKALAKISFTTHELWWGRSRAPQHAASDATTTISP